MPVQFCVFHSFTFWSWFSINVRNTIASSLFFPTSFIDFIKGYDGSFRLIPPSLPHLEELIEETFLLSKQHIIQKTYVPCFYFSLFQQYSFMLNMCHSQEIGCACGQRSKSQFYCMDLQYGHLFQIK